MNRKLWRIRELFRLSRERIRTWQHRALGATIGQKCLFGHDLRIDRPWTVTIGSRCTFEPSVWFDVVSDSASVKLGDHVFLARGVHLMISDGLTIGANSLLGDGVIISDHKHNVAAGRLIGDQGCNSAPVVIGSDVLICVRAIILQGVRIGNGAIIGPGAIVTQDVPENAIVGTAPARMLGNRQPPAKADHS